MASKDELYKELELKLRIEQEGINGLPKDFKNLPLGTVYQEKVHQDPEKVTNLEPGTLLPSCIFTPHGLAFGFHWNGKSPFTVQEEDGNFFLAEGEKRIFKLDFQKRAKFYSENSLIESDFSVQALKTCISMFEKYNNVRNNQSYAHTNSVLKKVEAEFIVKTISDILVFIDTLERSNK